MKSSTVIWCVVIAIVVGWGVMGSANSNNNHSTGNSSSKTAQTSNSSSSSSSSKTNNLSTSVKPPSTANRYEDSRWPTLNRELLAIPESQRWYNANSHVGTRCTLAGPVKNVYQAKQSKGMPIFIDVGADYSTKSGFTLLVWADSYDEFATMINEVDDGGAWLQVTGYLSSYNGRAQFNISDGRVDYKWWTHVN